MYVAKFSIARVIFFWLKYRAIMAAQKYIFPCVENDFGNLKYFQMYLHSSEMSLSLKLLAIKLEEDYQSITGEIVKAESHREVLRQ